VITLLRFQRLENAVMQAGFRADIDWTEQLSAPQDPEDFARAAIYVVANSGMKNTVAVPIFEKCMDALHSGTPIRRVFGHPGKAQAMEAIWLERQLLFQEFAKALDKIAFCAALPWVGPVTKYHLGRDLGADVAKPDVHLERLARRDRTTVERLCRRW